MKPPLELWTYWDFVYENGTNPISQWHKDLSDDAKNLLQEILKTNKKTENHLNWRNLKRFLKGEADEEKIWEIEFKADKLQYRLLGIFSPGRQAAFLIGCYHKQRVYEPTDCIKTAIKRSRLLKEGGAKRYERKIRLDI